ncbi:hypothetical protein TVAG_248950 [Trichomonas vaginalis G3]|uniref:Spindle assembly abnormal protein 6 N-terminal domain-containing protein n=1 Tax=Trichomonas vaginalis (strain ATCC PRA-98 / G3) TaxID=412133 RepID=A2DC99_TRIV3|nr:assembly abnormal protein 6-related family [Trichomonas vaginalis G3]EAY21836.1 hypothetical protein TVAG_248950 [Trichomonas vaginalis G3]KAI5487694.1 assembly abnormal protein 6-related family [Trichomonas vaginalis G3]|eukprot:XP_001582822.1 hypothetical protein [Trichomonas vaginalis G3]
MSVPGAVDEEFELFFDQDVPIENRLDQSPEEAEEDEPGDEYTNFSIVVNLKQTEDEAEAIKIQLYSKDVLSFLYEGEMSKEDFESFKAEQELDIDFNDFPNVLQEVLGQINEDIEENGYNARLIPDGEDACHLIIKQDLDLCTTEIFNIKLVGADQERIRKVSQARYNELSKRDNALRTQYKDLIKRIRRQDPKILQDFKLNSEIAQN